MKYISVIVPHYDQVGALKKCLQSLINQTIDKNSYEIVVTDNGTKGGLELLKESFPTVKFFTEFNRGAACARNTGMRFATGEIFAFIDADCVADPDWLSVGIEGLEDGEIVGGQVEISVENMACLSPVEAFERVFSFQQKRYVEKKNFSVTANIIVSAKTARAVGPFKNGVSEDVEWCHRARALGFRLTFNDKSIVRHPARRHWGELVSKWDRMIKERWNGFGGRKSVCRLLWCVLAVVTALSLLPHVFRVLTTNKLSSVEARVGALGVLVRIRCWRAVRMIQILCAPSASSD